MRYTITFPNRYHREPHPFFGDCPTLPYSYGYIDADTEDHARALAAAVFGTAWAFIYEGDASEQPDIGPHTWNEAHHQGLAFIIRSDSVNQPVITFPAPTPSTIDRTTITETP